MRVSSSASVCASEDESFSCIPIFACSLRGAPVGGDEHELSGRLEILESRGIFTGTQREALEQSVRGLIDVRAIEVAPRDTYAALEATALRRVPRDPRDWPTVALAIVLDAAILTGDNDFLGCGCPTWTVETLRRELELDGK
jgi:hypothetical protein